MRSSLWERRSRSPHGRARPLYASTRIEPRGQRRSQTDARLAVLCTRGTRASWGDRVRRFIRFGVG